MATADWYGNPLDRQDSFIYLVMSRKFTYMPQGGYIDEGYNPYMFGGKVDISQFLAKPRSRSRSKSARRGGAAKSRSLSRARSMSRGRSMSRERSMSKGRARSKSRARGGTSLGGSLLAEASRMLKGKKFKDRAARGKAVAKVIKDLKRAV